MNNFVQYKFSHLPSKERQTIMELAKMFLNQINYWQLETPSQRRQRVPTDDVAGYKANYTRWHALATHQASTNKRARSSPGRHVFTHPGHAYCQLAH